MRYRKLRIAWSVACGVVALLLCVLWMRSYTWMDSTVVLGKQLPLASYRGHILCNKPWWFIYTGPSQPKFTYSYGISSIAHQQLGMNIGDGGLAVPHWLLAALIAAAWTASCFRFSLRTLLIGMTLVAALLGAVIYASK